MTFEQIFDAIKYDYNPESLTAVRDFEIYNFDRFIDLDFDQITEETIKKLKPNPKISINTRKWKILVGINSILCRIYEVDQNSEVNKKLNNFESKYIFHK